MKNIIVLCALMVLLVSCNKLEGETTMKPGETRSNKDVSLKFLDYSDSRCPKGANCITQGYCAVWMEISDGTSTLPFTLGDSESPYENEFTGLDYNIRFIDFLPEPKVDETLTANDYKLHLIVTKL